MAVSDCAHAPSSPSSPSSPEPSETDENIDSIRNVHCVYACLEKLILPQRVTDDEDMHPTRSELGALVGLVNEELQRRIDAADATIKSLRGALRESDVQ